MRTIEVTVKFLHPRHTPSKKDCQDFVDGNCPACKAKDSVALQTSDEFTDFYACHECDLHIHREVLSMITGHYVPEANDALAGLLSAITDQKGTTPA